MIKFEPKPDRLIEAIEAATPTVGKLVAGAIANSISKRQAEGVAKLIAAQKKRPRGRPSIGKPWLAAGVSKATWYRRQKEKKS